MKTPRLFYWEEGIGAWIPAPDKVENMVDVDEDLEQDEVVMWHFKRVDMTDEEFDNLPEE